MEGALEGAWEDTSDMHSNRDLFDASWQQSGNASAAAMENAFSGQLLLTLTRLKDVEGGRYS
ncbi:hypothetical protein GQ600_3251 [Phytophthora cactorum]|nr:hypothetical protein GQ600_3251 [Phytophthora cactorum]